MSCYQRIFFNDTNKFVNTQRKVKLQNEFIAHTEWLRLWNILRQLYEKNSWNNQRKV